MSTDGNDPKSSSQTWQTRRSYLALVISILALLAASIQSYYTAQQAESAGEQVRITQQQLDDARKQFAENGPELTVATGVRLDYDNNRSEYHTGTVGNTYVLTSAALTGSVAAYLYVDMTNSGRSPAAIRSVTLASFSPTYRYSAGYVQSGFTIYCLPSGTSTSLDCINFLPRPLASGETVRVFFPLKPIFNTIAAPSRSASSTFQIEIDQPGNTTAPIAYLTNITATQ